MLEKDIEVYLWNKIKKLGGLYFKFISPGHAGVPDRLILYKGECWFVELKRPEGELRPLQKLVINQMKRHYDKIIVLKNKEEVDNFVTQISKRSS